MARQKRTRIDIAKLDANMRPGIASDASAKWMNPSDAPLQLVGFPWFDIDRVYRRLPLKTVGPLRPEVDALANCTAGGQVRFRSNTRKLAVRVTLTGPADMNHMPSTGQCGFDLYLGSGDHHRFYSVTKYDQTKSSYEVVLFEHPLAETRVFTLNFPLYQGVKEVLIGVEPDATVAEPPPFALPGKIVCYGTSITQGGCASRPGMAYTNILSRLLDAEFVNLGFSGNGRGEPEVAQAVSQIPDLRLFILDYDANAESPEHLQRTLPEFIHILRQSHHDTPILVVSWCD
jgi:hypothetical protein